MILLKQLYHIAILRLEEHNLAGAESLLIQILAASPSDVFAKHQLAKISLEQNQIERAINLLTDVATVLDDNADVLIDLGRANILANRSTDAITCLERACTLAPKYSESYRFLAEAFFAIGRFQDAAQQAEKAIFLTPGNAQAHSILGDALLEQGQVQGALSAYDQSLSFNPDSWKVHANKGIAYLHLEELEQAEQCLRLANALNPMQPSVVLPLVCVLIALKHHDDAQLLLNKLHAILPGDARVQVFMGDNALAQGNTQAAVAAYIKALSIANENIDIQLKLACALTLDGKLTNAIMLYDQVLDRDKQCVAAYIEKARLQLLTSETQAGFGTFKTLHQNFGQHEIPQLRDENLENKTILLHSKNSLDDFNVLIRFAREVKARGANVIVECTKPISSLVRRMTCVDAVMEVGDKLPSADFHAPLECLPAIFNISFGSTADKPYLVPEEALVSHWKDEFSSIGKFKVGLMWQKETDVHSNIYHSVPLSAFAPLFEISDIHIVSLATMTGVAQLKTFQHADKMQHVGLENAFFEERIACIAGLDLLITADTLTGQVACAAGLPTWFLLGNIPHWQFGLKNSKTVWHPTARLFRRSASSSFNEVVDQIALALSKIVSSQTL